MDEPNNTVHGNGFTAKIPEQWRDHSVLAWSAPATNESKIPPSIQITRSSSSPDANLKSHVNQRVQEMLNAESTIDIESKTACEWCGLPAIELVLKKQKHGLATKQRQIYALPEAGQALKIVFTAQANEFEQHQFIFNNFERSFVWDSLDYSY